MPKKQPSKSKVKAKGGKAAAAKPRKDEARVLAELELRDTELDQVSGGVLQTGRRRPAATKVSIQSTNLNPELGSSAEPDLSEALNLGLY